MKLLDTEYAAGITTKTWLHTDANGDDVFTTQTLQSADPVFKKAKYLAQNKGKDFCFMASIPANIINEICYSAAKTWGVKPVDVMRELMSSKTDRSKALWKQLTKGRDHRKFQASHYA